MRRFTARAAGWVLAGVQTFGKPFGTVLGPVLGITAVATAMLAGCSRQPKAYVLGAAAPQKLAYGRSNTAGINLAVSEINAAGGINGVPLTVLISDDDANGVQAVNVASAFVHNPNVLAVIGHAGSGAMVPAARVYDAGHLVALGTTPSTPDLTGISPWVFRLISSDSMNGTTLAAFASSYATHLGRPPRAAILYANDAYGRGLSEAFTRQFKGEIICDDPVGPGENFEPHVAFFKSRHPDIVFVASSEDIGIPFLHEARRQGLQAMFLGGDGWQSVVSDRAAAEGVYVGTPFTAQSGDTAARRFVVSYIAKYGTVPDAHAALAYDATRLLAQAIGAVGPKRDAIRAYLSDLADGTAFHGVTGTIRFGRGTNDPMGDNFIVTRVHDGLMLPEHTR